MLDDVFTNVFTDVSTYSMRSLRSSLASSSLGATSASRAVRQAESVTAYTAVPRQKLNLVELQVRMLLTSP